MNFPILSESRRVEMLAPPEGRVRYGAWIRGHL